jgi:hypothetical protein
MNNSVHLFCPHLGLKSDPTTSFGFPSKGNVCFHAKGHPTPELEYQRATCLTAQHIMCPVYKSPPGVRLPENIRQPKQLIKYSPKFIVWGVMLILLITAIFLAIRFRGQLIDQVSQIVVPAWKQTQQVLPSVLPPSPTLVIFPTETQPAIPTATAAPTSTPEPTLTATSTRGSAVMSLETPIGRDITFIIRRVIEGEAIGQYASRYNTTEAAIRAVNYDMPSVLFIDWLLVIPLDRTDVTGLPSFQPLQIQEGGITLEALANQLGVEAEEISLYNFIEPEHILIPGEWILVPRE